MNAATHTDCCARRFLPRLLGVFLVLGLVATLAPNAGALSRPPYPVIFVHGFLSSLVTWDDYASVLSNAGWIGWRLTFNPALQADPDSGQPAGPPYRGDYYRFSFSDNCISLIDPIRFGHNCHLTFEQQASELKRVIDAVRTLNSADRVILVAHSMGGLAARRYLEFHSSGGDVSALITVGTPHYGADYAILSSVLTGTRELRGVQDMDPGSPALRDLTDHIANLPRSTSYLSVVGQSTGFFIDGDGIVPAQSQDLGVIAGAKAKTKKVDMPFYPVWPVGCAFLVPFVGEEVHTCETIDPQIQFEVLDAILDPRLAFRLNQSTFAAGQTLRLSMTSQRGFPGGENTGDLYLALQTPGGSAYAHNGIDWRLVFDGVQIFSGNLQPFRRNTTLQDTTEIIIESVLPALPPGSYTFLARLVKSGAPPLDDPGALSNLAAASWTFLGSPPTGQITIVPTSLNFGNVQVGSCSTATFSVQHVSGTAAVSGSVTTSAPFSITSGSPFNVADGPSSATITIQFCPTGAGPASGTASISSNASSANTSTVALSGIGTTPAGQITISPTSLNFGSVQLGGCFPASFAIQHVNGTAPVSGTVSTSAPFSITSGNPFNVADGPNNSALIGLQFCPTSAGAAAGIASISSNASSANTSTVALSGIGTTPAGQITISPTSLNFGSVQVGGCFPASFAVQHVNGTAPVSGTIATIAPFSITSGSPFTVADGANSSALIGLQFCPTSAGAASGMASISSNASSSNTNTVALTGSGTTPTLGSIFGRVTRLGSGLSGTNMTLAGPLGLTTVTDSNGSYVFANLPSGSYTVTPNRNGCSAFAPSARSVSVSGVAVTGQDFDATCVDLPVAPSSLAATEISASQINVSWQDNSSNETGFEIQRRDGTAAFTTRITFGPNVTSFEDLLVTTGVTYTYRVRSFNGAGSSGFSNEASATPGATIKPDLTITTFTPPSSAAIGAIIPFSATVRNNGTGLAPLSLVGFYFSSGSSITTSNQFLGQCAVPELPAGASAACNPVSITVPTVAPGQYYVAAIVDPSNQIVESNETNNNSGSRSFTVTSGPGGFGSVTINATFNGSPWTSSGPGIHIVGPNYENNLDLSGGGVTLTTQPAGSWTVSYVSGGPAGATLSSITPSATQTLSGGGSITFTFNFTGGALPDLRVQTANGPDDVTRGTPISLAETIEVVNNGSAAAGAFRIGFYWSRDQVFSADDVFAGSCTVSSLAIGTLTRCGLEGASVTLNVPVSLGTGTYYLITVADDLNQIVELTESNNWKADCCGTTVH